MESILDTIKDSLGVDLAITGFDSAITLGINTALMTLNQLGVGPDGYTVTSNTQKWTDYLGETVKVEAVKTYISLQVRLLFDPPSGAYILEAFERRIRELEWRIAHQVEPKIEILVLPDGGAYCE